MIDNHTQKLIRNVYLANTVRDNAKQVQFNCSDTQLSAPDIIGSLFPNLKLSISNRTPELTRGFFNPTKSFRLFDYNLCIFTYV
uniref:Uncharacterized protein n=1 Tax=Megaselia scalaris TaxID=36166 RepID=T1H4X0_MEGSC